MKKCGAGLDKRGSKIPLPFSIKHCHHITHLSTAVAWREKKCKHFVFNKYFSLVLGLLKSKISEKIN